MRNVSNYIIQIHFYVLHAWSRLVELPSSDEMKMFYTEHDFQVDLEIYEFSLKFHAERIDLFLRPYLCYQLQSIEQNMYVLL